MSDLGELSIGITASASQAGTAIDSLVRKLNALNTAMGRISGAGLNTQMNIAAQGANAFGQALTGINGGQIKEAARAISSLATAVTKMSGVDTSHLPALANNLRMLSTVNLNNLASISSVASAFARMGSDSALQAITNIPNLAVSLRTMENVSIPDPANIVNLGIAVQKLGSNSARSAAVNLPFLADGLQRFSGIVLPDGLALADFARTLSSFGHKSAQNAVTTIPLLATAFEDLVNRLSKLPPVSQNTINLANAMATLAKHGNTVPGAINRASLSLSGFSTSAKAARKHALSLAAVFGKLYANFFLVIRAARLLGNSINIASDLTEVQNVVDVAFADMKYKIEDFAATSRQQFGMTELQAKQFASRFQAMGSAMGITNSQVQRANEFLGTQGLTGAYTNLGDSMADVSVTLTKLTADMGSFYNAEYTDVAEDLQAILTGMARPLTLAA